jgi:hypothetical protein
MDNEIQLISDGDGLAVIGDPAAAERVLASEGLPSKDLGLPSVVIGGGMDPGRRSAGPVLSLRLSAWAREA